MIPGVTELAVARKIDEANTMLSDGWQLVAVTDSGWHFAHIEETPDDWREPFIKFLDNLDPAEVDRKVLESTSFDEGGVTAGVLRYLRQALGCPE